MKALDTSVLLALLEGDRSARELVRKLRDVEVATTEVNLLELTYLAARGPPRARNRRREAIERLRRKITVLPVDARAVSEAQGGVLRGEGPPVPLVAAMLGALEAAGCDELFTSDPSECRGRWRFHLTRFSRRTTK